MVVALTPHWLFLGSHNPQRGLPFICFCSKWTVQSIWTMSLKDLHQQYTFVAKTGRWWIEPRGSLEMQVEVKLCVVAGLRKKD